MNNPYGLSKSVISLRKLPGVGPLIRDNERRLIKIKDGSNSGNGIVSAFGEVVSSAFGRFVTDAQSRSDVRTEPRRVVRIATTKVPDIFQHYWSKIPELDRTVIRTAISPKNLAQITLYKGV